jgi:hypothetical protein
MAEDWKPAEQLLNEWAEKCLVVQKAHFVVVDRYANCHLWLGIPTVVLSTIVGSSMFYTLQQEVSLWVKAFVAALSLGAALLAALQTFLAYSEHAAKHRAAGAAYGNLRRSIQVVLAQSARPDPVGILKETEQRMSDLAMTSPALPKWASAS